MSGQNRLGLAIQLNVLGTGGPEIFDVNSDPNGTEAPTGSLALRRDVGQAWLNVGGMTWNEIGGGWLYNPIPTNVILGFGNASEGEIVYYNTNEWVPPYYFDVMLLGRKRTSPYSFADDDVAPFGKYCVVIAAPGSTVSAAGAGGGHVYGSSTLILGGDATKSAGTAEITGGGVLVRAGSASGTGTSTKTGGKVEIYGGQGTNVGGDVYIQSGRGNAQKSTSGNVDIVGIRDGLVRISSQDKYVQVGNLLPGERGSGPYPVNASIWSGDISVSNHTGILSVTVGTDMSGLVIQASFCVETTTGNLAAGGNIVISDGGTPTASIVIPAAAVSLWDTTTCRSGITYTENQNFQITVSLVDEAVEATVSYVLMLAQATK